MKQYTPEDVEQHNTQEDCWIIVNGNVYDITDFLSIHPGGSSIVLSVAGKDASDYFNELHRPEILDDVGKEYLIGHMGKNTL